jgi:hypothetical protein
MWLLAGALADAALVATLVARYPAVVHEPGAGLLLALLVVGIAGAVAAAVVGLRTREPLVRNASRAGTRWGFLLGGLWVLEMTVANEWYGVGAWRLVPYYGAILGVLVLNVLAGALAAYRSGRIAAGTLVGLWAGLVSGVIGLATMALQVLLTLPVLRADPQNVAEAGHRDLTTSIVGDQLAGGIAHLVIVGPVAGTALATLGALVGGVSRRSVVPRS